MKTLLIVYHSRTHTARLAALMAKKGADSIKKSLAVKHQILLKQAPEVTLEDLLNADSYLFCAPENLGTLSGAMKECLDTYYYDVLGKLEGRPFSAIIGAGTDGSGALRQLRTICTGWRLNEVVPSKILLTQADTPETIQAPKVLTKEQEEQAWEIGATLFALMA